MVNIEKYYSLIGNLSQARRARESETQSVILIDEGWALFNILDF